MIKLEKKDTVKLVCKKELSRHNGIDNTIFYKVGDTYNYDGSPVMQLLVVHNMKVESLSITREVLFEHFYKPGEYRNIQIDSILND